MLNAALLGLLLLLRLPLHFDDRDMNISKEVHSTWHGLGLHRCAQVLILGPHVLKLYFSWSRWSGEGKKKKQKTPDYHLHLHRQKGRGSQHYLMPRVVMLRKSEMNLMSFFNLFQFNFGLLGPGIFCRWFVPKWKCVGKDQRKSHDTLWSRFYS